MKKIFLLLVASFVCTAVNAEQISESQAANIASKYLLKQPSKTLKALKNNNVTPDNAEYYIFNTDNNQGFAIISGDDELTELVAYSDNGSFILNSETPENIKKWLNDYSEYVNNFRDGKAKGQLDIPNRASVVVAPLLKTKWDQGKPYNNLCPTQYYKGQEVVCPTGCAATALAQVMNYWQWPEVGQGSHSYTEPNTSRSHYVDFSQSRYDWANMRDTYLKGQWTEAEANAVSKLMYDCGVAIDMEYAPEGSGAIDHNIKIKAPKYFQYDTEGYQRDSYSSYQFLEIIKKALDQKKPILFGGIGTGGGHEYVADGYDSNDYLHINWGWAGSADGYYNINYMNPDDLGTGGGSGGFNYAQSIIILTPNKDGNATTNDTYLNLIPEEMFPQYDSYVKATKPSVQKGDKLVCKISGLWNSTSQEYSGEMALAVFDTECNRLTTPTFKKSFTIGGTMLLKGEEYLSLQSELENLADGYYYIFVVTKEVRNDIISEWVRICSDKHETIKVEGSTITTGVDYNNSLKIKSPVTVNNSTPKPGDKIIFTISVANQSMVKADGSLRFEIFHAETGARKMRLNKKLRLPGLSEFNIQQAVNIGSTFAPGEKYLFKISPDFATKGVHFEINTQDSNDCEFTVVDPAGVENLTAEDNIVVYPNPAAEKVFVKTSADLISTSLYAADGRLVKTVDDSDVIDLTDCNAGYYIISVKTTEGTVNKQIIKK